MHLVKRLCTPSNRMGVQAPTLQVVHTGSLSQLPRTWVKRMMHAAGKGIRLYAVTSVCTEGDEACALYQAWLDSKSAHEDDAEAERLRSEDLKEAGP